MKHLFPCFIGIVWVLVIIGWVLNLVSVITMAGTGATDTTLFVLKAVGIVIWPLGGLLGLFF